MNCREFASLVLDLTRNQALNTTARAQALQHAELCVYCAARLAEERAWLANVRLVVTELAQHEVPAHIEVTLLAALRAQTERKPALPQPSLSLMARWWQWRLAAAVAALVLIVVLAGLAWLNLNGKEQKQDEVRLPAPPTNPTPQVLTVNDDKVNTPAPKQVRVTVRQTQPRRRVPQPVTQPSEVATPFYSLVEEDAVAPLESGRVVRVEVPASTLIPFGLPLTAEAMTQSVQADLLLGQDGLARAIRFLPAGQNTKTQ